MDYSTKSTIAKRYGFDIKTVSNWMTERGADSCWCSDKRKFREPEITEWVVKNIITPLREVDNKELMDQAKLRKLDAEARIMEMKARETANSLIPVQLVEASVSKFSSMVRTSMLQIATTQAQPILEAATDTRTLKRVLAEIINERLDEVGQVMKSGEFLSDENITQYSEDEDHNDGHSTDDSTIEDSVSDDNDIVSGVSDAGSDSGDSDPDFFED